MNSFSTFAEVIQYVENNYSNPTALNDREAFHWKPISTQEFIFDIKRLAHGLIQLGLRKGDTVGILSPSSARWTIADLAVVMAGGITVPLFANLSHENFIFEVAQANVRFLFVQGEEQWSMYAEHRTLFEKVIGFDEMFAEHEVMSFHEVLKKGEERWEKQPTLWEELIRQQHTEDVITIIYTSGSTGLPKGVELTHRNLLHLVNFEVFNWKPNESYLNILPLAHVFARQISFIMIRWGISIYYLNDLSQMVAVAKEIRPNLMILVPRVLEKIYSGIVANIQKEKGLKRWIGQWAINLANTVQDNALRKYVLRPIANLFVYRSLRESLGGHWRVILCGGAALSSGLYLFYLRIGIPIYEGWGLSEGSTACVNTPKYLKIGTVGKPLPGIKVKVIETGELLIGGPTVMKGYYRNPDATQMAIDAEGWLHTGDKGEIDKEGFVKLIGRVKEQFKLSSGEYVSPSRIEHSLCQHPLVDLAMIVGEKQKFAACLLFPDFTNLKKLKTLQKAENFTDKEFLESSYVQQEMDILLKQVNSKLNSWERLQQYRFILDTLSIDKGELTPTMKIKREAVTNKYQDFIETIYREKLYSNDLKNRPLDHAKIPEIGRS
jgi:long-chain acyl-CoA synthetase